MTHHSVYYAFLFLLFFVNPLQAYIDPGTGSLLASTLMGIILTALFSLRGFFYKGKGLKYKGEQIRRKAGKTVA